MSSLPICSEAGVALEARIDTAAGLVLDADVLREKNL